MTQRPHARSTGPVRAAYRDGMIIAPLDMTSLHIFGAALVYSSIVLFAMRR